MANAKLGVSSSSARSRSGHSSADDASNGFKLREKWPYALDRDGLIAALTKDYSGNTLERESVYLLDEFELNLTGSICFRRARSYLEVCVLESPFVADTPTAIFSIGQSSHSSGVFDSEAVVKQAVHGQIDGLKPGTSWCSLLLRRCVHGLSPSHTCFTAPWLIPFAYSFLFDGSWRCGCVRGHGELHHAQVRALRCG